MNIALHVFVSALAVSEARGSDVAERRAVEPEWVSTDEGWRVEGAGGLVAHAGAGGGLDAVHLPTGATVVFSSASAARVEAAGATLAETGEDVIHEIIAVKGGLQHLVTLRKPEASPTVSISIDGLMPSVVDEQTVALRDGDGQERLSYSGLFVFDAASRRQTAWFEVSETSISIRIEPDDNAEWPIIIDPILSGIVLQQGDQSLSFFGTSSASADFNADGIDDLVVGAPDEDLGATNNGEGMVFFGAASGFPQLQGGVLSPNLQNNGRCGNRVAAGDADNDGDEDIVIACTGETPKRVYVFKNDGTGQFPSVIALAPGAQEMDLGSGNMAVVDLGGDGLKEVVIGGTRTSVYRLSAASPLVPATIAPIEELNLGSNSRHWAPCKGLTGLTGVVVGHEGRVVLRDPNPTTFLLTGGAHTNIPGTAIETSPGQTGDTFPACGDYDGDGDGDVAFGYPQRNAAAGEVYAFRRDPGGFVLASGFPVVGSAGSAEQLGSTVMSVDHNADRRPDLVVCAPFADSGALDAGRCFAWGGHPSTGLFATSLVRWTITGGAGGLGSLTIGNASRDFAAGNTDGDGGLNIVVADPRGTTNGQVRIADAERAGPAGVNLIAPESNLTDASMGRSIAVGDIDQDGFDDVVVGMPGASSGSGRIVIYRGGSSMDATIDRTITASGLDRFGAAIAIGRFRGPANPPSIAVSEPEWDSSGNNNVGRVWIFDAPVGGLPTATTTAGAAAVQLIGTVIGESYGESLANCGSLINATGDCLAIGAPSKVAGAAITNGSVYIHRSQGAAGLVAGPTTTKTGVSNDSGVNCAWGFGAHVANAGNVASGADDDLLVGAPGCANGSTDEGRAFLYTSVSASDSINISPWFQEANQVGAGMGPVAGLGDVNGDGIADFAVGAPLLDTNSVDNGRVFVFLGSAGNPSTSAASTMSTSYSGQCGSAIAGRVDVNRDGLMDLIVGEPTFSNNGGTLNEGRVRVFPGRLGQGPDFEPLFTLEGNCSSCFMGTSVAMGDVNGNVGGDIYGDIAIGIPGYTNPSTREGRIIVRIGQW